MDIDEGDPPAGSSQAFPGTARFTVLNSLGAGGMGEVYRVLDNERGVHVALKCMKKLGASALVRFKNEFRALQDVHHPNLVRLGELVQEGEDWFFTMELIEGCDFLSYVRKGGITGRKTATLLTTHMESQLPPTSETIERECMGTSTGFDNDSFSEPMQRKDSEPISPEKNSSRRIGTEFIEDKLRSALRQLALGLQRLHQTGKVHRDIKPSNVLVTHAGRVVIVDFGLIVDPEDAIWQDRHLVGTVGYMAPEQAAGTELGPATDWYSVGVLLYVSLTGYPPLGAGGKLPPPIALDPTVPEDLSALCLQLLEKDPHKRAGAKQILDVIPAAKERPTSQPLPSPPASVFVGREKELDTLQQAYATSQQHAMTVLVTGESGVGKSTLVNRFLNNIAQSAPDTLILQARCYEREVVPYKGVDGIVDAISQYLVRMPRAQVAPLLPDNLAALARLFPALQRLQPMETALAADTANISEQEQRWRGFRALRDLLGNMSAQQSVVLSIDDLQWANADSWQLLTELVREPGAARLLLIGTQRGLLATETPDIHAIDWDHWPSQKELIELGHLDPNAAADLAAALLQTDASESRLRALVTESQGHPLFLTELCHFAPLHRNTGDNLQLEQTVSIRMEALHADMRHFFHVVAIAGAPILLSVAVRATRLAGEKIDETLHQLSSKRFIQTQGTQPHITVAPYHDRIRSCALRSLTNSQCVLLHRALAKSLEQCDPPQPQFIATHWQEAKEFTKACVYWIQAAEKAAQALAFDQAARLYQKALEMQQAFPDDESRETELQYLRIQHAEALAKAGSILEAARAFQEAGERLSGKRALALKHRAAVQLLRGGHIDKGIAALQPTLQAYGITMPMSRRHAIATFLWERLRLKLTNPNLSWQWTEECNVDPALLAKTDICLNIATGLLNIDHIRGIIFHTRALRYALCSGEPHRVGRTTATEAILMACLEGDKDVAYQIVDTLESLTVRLKQPKKLAAYYTHCRGAFAMFFGHWKKSLELMAEAQKHYNMIPGDTSWELASCDFSRRNVQFLSGLWTETSTDLATSIRKTYARGNLYHAAATRIGFANLAWLIDDDPNEARRQVLDAVKEWSQQGVHLQHLLEIVAYAHIDLYQGDYSNAFYRVDTRRPVLRKAGLFRWRFNEAVITNLHARVALACVFANTPELKRARKQVILNIKRLLREHADWTRGTAKFLQAQLAYAGGNKHVIPLFEEATELLDSLDMPFWATASRSCLSYIQHGAVPPHILQAHCLRTVKKPLRFLSIYAPMLQVLL